MTQTATAQTPLLDAARDYEVIVIGAGVAGIYQIKRLADLGVNATLLEAYSDLGGTWFNNRYPGARFDSESFTYGYSFSKELLDEWDWSEWYSPQPETLRYLNFVADKFDLRKHMQFSCRVAAMHFQDETNTWRLTLTDGRVLVTRFVITGLGVLSIPTRPSFKGMETFKGLSFHPFDWPHDQPDLTGKRVAIIGTGAQINQDTSGVDASQAVHVAAGNDFYHIGVAGSAGVSGTAAVGVGLQIALVKHTTEAQINGKVNAAGDITARAHGADKIVCVAIGFAASGLVGVGGSVGVNTFSNTTRASIGANAEVLAGGSVIVKASDDSSGLVIAGAAGIGIGAAGVGISVAVTKFDKTTEAFIGNGAKVTALGGGSGASALTGLDNGSMQAGLFFSCAQAATPLMPPNFNVLSDPPATPKAA